MGAPDWSARHDRRRETGNLSSWSFWLGNPGKPEGRRYSPSHVKRPAEFARAVDRLEQVRSSEAVASRVTMSEKKSAHAQFFKLPEPWPVGGRASDERVDGALPPTASDALHRPAAAPPSGRARVIGRLEAHSP